MNVLALHLLASYKILFLCKKREKVSSEELELIVFWWLSLRPKIQPGWIENCGHLRLVHHGPHDGTHLNLSDLTPTKSQRIPSLNLVVDSRGYMISQWPFGIHVLDSWLYQHRADGLLGQRYPPIAGRREDRTDRDRLFSVDPWSAWSLSGHKIWFWGLTRATPMINEISHNIDRKTQYTNNFLYSIIRPMREENVCDWCTVRQRNDQ